MKTSKRGKMVVEPDGKGINFAQPLIMKKKILIADDDSSMRDIFQIIFEKKGYDTQLLSDASEIFKKNFRVPDIFLIDKLLSGIDGLDVCAFLKNDPLTSHVPVVMVSASPDIGVSSAKAGADDFVEKPFDMNYLLLVIERNIGNGKKKSPSKRAMSAE